MRLFIFLFAVPISRSLESQLFNKANELQEDICLKRFDLRVAQIHLSAVKSQVGTTSVKLPCYTHKKNQHL